MNFPRIESAIAHCRDFVNSNNTATEEIENMLTDSLLIIICGEFEKKYKQILLERFSGVEDISIKHYLDTTVRIRSLKISDISQLLDNFGRHHSLEFQRLRKENRMAEIYYENIRTNRNNIAHGGISNITLNDIEEYYTYGNIILDMFSIAILKK